MHKSNIEAVFMAVIQPVPTYALYGEDEGHGGPFWVHCETIPARSRLHHWEIGMHRHSHFFQILSVTEGSGDAVLNEEIVRFEPVSLITIPPGFTHGFRFSPDVDGHVITVSNDRVQARVGQQGWMREFLSKPRVTRIFEAEHRASLPIAISQITEECQKRQGGWPVFVESAIAQVLVMLARAANIERRRHLAIDTDDNRLELLLSLVHRHVREHRPVTFFAEAVGVSPTHLNRIVKAKTGLSTQSLISARLLNEAQRELLFTAGTVQEIAFRLGFGDPAYFSRFFLKQVGMTPRHWKAQHQQRLGTRDESDP